MHLYDGLRQIRTEVALRIQVPNDLNRLDLISITVVIIAKSILTNTSLGVRLVMLDRGF